MDLLKDLLKSGALEFGSFDLTAGLRSPYFVDCSLLPAYASAMNRAGHAMCSIISNLPEMPTLLCGNSHGGVPFAFAVQYTALEWGSYYKIGDIPVCYTRKDPIVNKKIEADLKDKLRKNEFLQGELAGVRRVAELLQTQKLGSHGKAKFVDGPIPDGARALIIEDVISTGKSSLEAADLFLRECEQRKVRRAKIIGVAAYVDRELGGREALEKAGMPLSALIRMRDAAHWLEKQLLINSEQSRAIIGSITAYRNASGLEKTPVKI